DVDPDDSANESLIVDLPVPVGDGTVSVTDGLAEILSGNGTEQLRLKGSVNELNAVLGTLVYTVPDDDFNVANNGGPVLINVKVDDQGHSGVDINEPTTFFGTVTITVNPVNDAPEVQLSASPLNLDEGPDATLALGGLSILDVDVDETGGDGAMDVTLSLNPQPGTVPDPDPGRLIADLSLVNGVPPAQLSGNDTHTITITGATKDQINATLASLVYRVPHGDFNSVIYGGDVVLTVTVDDNANFGSGGALGDSDSVDIHVTPTNDNPQFTKGSNLVFDEDSGPQTLAWGTDIQAGPDSATDELAVQAVSFDVQVVVGGSLAFVSGGEPAIRVVVDPQTSEVSGELTFETAEHSNGFAEVQVILNDDGQGGLYPAGSSAPVMFTINTTAVNDAPTIDDGLTDPIALTEIGFNDAAPKLSTAIDTIVIADLDAGETSGGKLTVTLQVPEGDGTIRVDDLGNVDLSDNGTHTVTLDGTVGNLNATLATLVYTVPDNDFNSLNNGGDVVLTATVNDNGLTGKVGPLSDSHQTTISIAPTNDPPLVANAIVDTTVDEDAEDVLVELFPDVFTDVDLPEGDALTFQVVSLTRLGPSGPLPLDYSPQPFTGSELTLDFLDDQNGVVKIVVQATDSSNDTVRDTFT
ncbi:MAG: hypothetical protein ACC645_26155, partial [Pirellulales bacterium]